MRLGLYSETGRRHIVAARRILLEACPAPTPQSVRELRQKLLCDGDPTVVRRVAEITDFYSLSACRDLLFHSEEHRLTLPEIAAFLAANDLAFLGFEGSYDLVRRYAARFPADREKTNLANWHLFEQECPDSFVAMYRFWVARS